MLRDVADTRALFICRETTNTGRNLRDRQIAIGFPSLASTFLSPPPPSLNPI